MRILNLSLDASILKKDSVSAQRIIEYGKLTEKYYLVAPSEKADAVELSERVSVFGSGGSNRLVQLFNIYKISKKILAQEKIDCITAQDPFEIGLIGLFLAKQFRVKLNVQEHGDFFSQKYWRNERFLHFVRYYAGIFVVRRADTIRVVSERIKKYLTGVLKISENKITVVPVFTELKKYESPKKRDNDDFVFLNLGRFVKQKNLPLLIAAFAQVLKQYPRVKLTMIGKGPEEDNLKKLCAKLGIGDRVNFFNWVDNPASYYAKADAYVLSSNYEGWGRVIIEAAAAGLPIAMTDVGCANEVLVHERSALISKVNDLSGLAHNMLRLAGDPDLRSRLATCALTDIEKLPNKAHSLDLLVKSWTKQ